MEMSELDNMKTIYTSEWSILKAKKIKEEYGEIDIDNSDYDLINKLEEERKLKINRLTEGIEIKTYSYVGTIRLSNFQVIIKPKIEYIYLAKMISYSYNLDINDIRYYDSVSNLDIRKGAITDLIALLFIREVEKIILKGLAKRYKQKEESISTCRGKILFNDLAKKSTAELTLPCRYRELTTDIAENRLIYSTLDFLKKLVNTSEISRKINVLSERLSKKTTFQSLDKTLFQKVEIESNRLTQHYKLVFELSRLIYDNYDFSLMKGETGFSSFLIDMNELFEKFLYRLFESSFESIIDVRYQNSLENGYITSDGSNRSLIPDYKFYKDNELIGIADAKYKDYSNKKVSSGDLYQLTTYAVANTQNINTIMLFYPVQENQKTERYSLHSPFLENKIDIINIGIPIKNYLENLQNIRDSLKVIIENNLR